MNSWTVKSHQLSHAKVHFIGIGGIGMCGLAELLHNLGANVSGSDMNENSQIKNLKAQGISKIYIGHDEKNIGDAEVVVYSSAIKSDNVEFKKARSLDIPLIPRAEALAELMSLKRGIAIGGTHGKTTTTSLTASILLSANQEPTIIVGGRLDAIQSTAKLGSGDWLVAESDESDGSFNKLSPEVVVITNIDNDHIDHYQTFQNLEKAFYDFASRIPFFGLAILCGDDPIVKKNFIDFPKRSVFYGFNNDNDVVLSGENGEYEVFQSGKSLGKFIVPLPGKHNALNSLAAILVGMATGLSFEDCKKGVQNFKGVDRRFQNIASYNGIEFYDDYGHHPTEIKAVLKAFKEKFKDNRLVVLFQPHRYSRTQNCWNDFVNSFDCADVLYMANIYPAGEKPLTGISSIELLKNISHSHSKNIDIYDLEQLKEISQGLKKGDVFVTLGAGDVWKIGSTILEMMRS